MIRNFMSVKDLQFPLAVLDKPKRIEETPTTLTLGGTALLKQHGLYDTFNIAIKNLPYSYSVIYTPSGLFDGKYKYKGRIFLTDALNVVIPNGKVKVRHFTTKLKFYSQKMGVIQVPETYDIPYLIPISKEKTATYAIIAEVDGLFFHTDWTLDSEYKNEFYI